MDYDFSRLSSRSFEQLIQALALAVIGPGVTVFGDGPDGGREAVFEGKITFPDTTNGWDGYGIIQAKFRQKLSSAAVDGGWVLSEQTKELRKFTGTRRKLKRPKFYILATNVALSSVANSGAKDKLTKLMSDHKKKIGLIDFRIWDYTQICAFIDAHESIRKSYFAWITPGDLIASVVEQMRAKIPDFRETMLSFLQKELRSDQYVNLGQAGYTGEEHTQLANVFVDLSVEPIVDSSTTSSEDLFARENRSGALKTLVDLSNCRLTQSTGIDERSTEADRLSGRVVFIGGPGQGKSTLSQFICQLNRTVLLRSYSRDVLLPETRATMQAVDEQCVLEEVSCPTMPRFPVRIELNKFASALAERRVLSLIDYVVQRINLRTQRDICIDDMRSWLSHFPWILVLDGLDEVPPSSNRPAVLDAIQDFLIDAAACKADLLLMATTRPQGYDDDFSPRYYAHFQLLPLTVEEALHYAERLIGQRWANDGEKVARLMERMRRAGSEEATARLMRSPLQVTIMSLLVETIGQPPKERWRLFGDYYQVISRREKERDIPAATLLNNYEPDIDSIHQRVGLVLQRASEQSGGTDATLQEMEFAAIVDERLAGEGHHDVEKDKLVRDIISAALERLVFLVAPQQSQIGFEIRSLQEFMAAQCLMSGGDMDVRRRLAAIAVSAHWRNVFLFAAGRCFHEKQHLRDILYSLVSELNEVQEELTQGLESAVLLGSQLALDIIEDGSLINQPGQLRIYNRLALRLVNLPPCIEQVRLAKTYREVLAPIFKEELGRAILSADGGVGLGAWRVLLNLYEQGVEWAISLVKERWPDDINLKEKILLSVDQVRGEWLSAEWSDVVSRIGPNAAETLMGRHTSRGERVPDQAYGWLRSLADKDTSDLTIEVDLKSVDSCFALTVIPVFGGDSDDEPGESIDVVIDNPNAHQAWIWLAHCDNFRKRPSVGTLIDVLVKLDEWWFEINGSSNLEVTREKLAWPISACLKNIQSKNDVAPLIEAARAGLLGNEVDWAWAQRRWADDGVVAEDLNYLPLDALPFDKRIADIGFVWGGSSARATHSATLGDAVGQLHSIWINLQDGTLAKQAIGSHLLFVASVAASMRFAVPDSFINDLWLVLDGSADRWFRFETLYVMPDSWWSTSSVVGILDRLCEGRRLTIFRGQIIIGDKLERLMLQNPESVGVLRCFAKECALGYKPAYFPIYAGKIDDSEFTLVERFIITIAAGVSPPSDLCEAIGRYFASSTNVNDALEEFSLACTSHGGPLLAGPLFLINRAASDGSPLVLRSLFRLLQDAQRRRLCVLGDLPDFGHSREKDVRGNS